MVSNEYIAKLHQLEDTAIQRRKCRLVHLLPQSGVGSTSTTLGPILIDSKTTSEPTFFHTRKKWLEIII